MADKLLIEVEMLNDRAEDAVFALIHLIHELSLSPTIHFRDESDWDEFPYDTYKLKWRFAEDPTRDGYTQRLYAHRRR